MSAQRLSDKSARRVGRATGLDIVRAWGHGGYTFDFVVADDSHEDGHRHGWYDRKTGEHGWYDPTYMGHYNTCFTELFPRD